MRSPSASPALGLALSPPLCQDAPGTQIGSLGGEGSSPVAAHPKHRVFFKAVVQTTKNAAAPSKERMQPKVAPFESR